MTSRKLICVIGMIFAAFSRSSNADVIFDDFGPGNGVLGAMSWDVNAGFATTAEFTSHASYTLTQIDVYLVNGVGGGTNAATISLLSSTNDGAPGFVMGSWSVSGQPTSAGGPLLTTISSISGVYLAKGTSYFLRIEPADATTQDGWVQNYLGLKTTIYNGNSLAYSSAIAPAFDVIGIAM